MSSRGKIVCIVLDGVGIGAAPDAHLYHDENSNTLCNTAAAVGRLDLPNMQKLGLGNIASISGVAPVKNADGCFGKMQEVSKGKDSTTGHWEFSGLILEKDFPYYPDGFPKDVVEKFCSLTELKGILGNKAASGTAIIEELGEEHIQSGMPIIYTSADSVFQLAVHEEIIPVEKMYEMCTIARNEVLTGKHAVGRVIARPFNGTPGNFRRTANRRDFSLVPPGTTMLDILMRNNVPTIAIGKIDDLFAGKGLKEKIHTKSNQEGIDQTVAWMGKTKSSFIFANLVDFDQLFGHRQDPKGMKDALEHFDVHLPIIIDAMNEDDILMITADHGNDPTDNSTDHSREYVPLLTYSRKGKKGVDLGTRKTFADLGNTVVDYFGFDTKEIKGSSFLNSIV